MVSPIFSDQQQMNQNSTNIFHQIQYWIGRIVATCVQISSDLYHLFTRVEKVASPIIQSSFVTPLHSPLATPSEESEEEINLSQMLDLLDEKKHPSPNQKRLSLQLTPGIGTKDRILESFLKTFGFDEVSEFLEAGVFSELTGKTIDSTNVENLNGEFKIEWKLNSNQPFESAVPHKLFFQGHLKNGNFDGPGILSKECGENTQLVLDGEFEKGAFISGTVVSPDEYIEGTFNKGCKTGRGIIRYLRPNDPNDPLFSHLDYNGEFKDGIPHGEGKAYLVNSNGVKLLAKGNFNKGMLTKGVYQEDDGRTFDGKWVYEENNLSYFKGKIYNHKEEWNYEGESLNGEFHGAGKLKARHSYKYDDVQIKKINGVSVVDTVFQKESFINCVCDGKFDQGKFHTGQQTIQWDNNQTGTQTHENGFIITSTIITKEGLKYVGQFESYTLDGDGTVYLANGQEVYSGDLKCGIPHGKGRTQTGNTIYEGEFFWGEFKNSLNT